MLPDFYQSCGYWQYAHGNLVLPEVSGANAKRDGCYCIAAGTFLAICSFKHENQGKEALSEFRIETLGNNEKKELD